MFKKQNKNHKKIIKSFKNIILFIFLTLFFINFSFSFEISLKNSINKIQNTINRNASVKIWWKAIIEDLYKNSLDKIQINNMVPLFVAINKTINDINTQYTCNMSEEDIINVLYFTNSSFKQELINNLDDFEKPNRSSLWVSCNKFNTCIDWNFSSNTVASNKSCQNHIENIFLNFYTDAYYNENVWKQTIWTDSFWNNDLNDSSYDILNDVYSLWKILFQEIKSPITTLFYSMPKTSNANVFWEPTINMEIDWFSPYNIFYSDENTSDTNTTETIEELWGIAQTDVWNTSWDVNVWVVTWWVWWEPDSSIQNFINSVNINLNNPSSSFIWNQCVSSFESEKYMISLSTNEQAGTPITPEEYLESVIEELEELNCNNDGMCQDRESNSCPDCQTSSYDLDDPSSVEEIQNILENAAEQWESIPEDDPVLGCFQKCSLMKCNATDCPKFVCYAKCLCQTISYDGNFELSSSGKNITWLNNTIRAIGLSSDFSMKFCIIPAVWEGWQDKTVYNITSIFSELHKVLEGLRNSWNMWINIKPKEFLEHPKQENNFAKQASFSINSTTKPISSNQSKDWIEKEQINLNTDLMEQVLWFSKEHDIDKEKNKYIVVDEPCEHKVWTQAGSLEEKTALMNSCKEEETMNVQWNTENITSTITNQNIILINSEFDSFMVQNRDFRYQTKLMFGELRLIAESLKNKK